jgi:trk system potassium uptake protein TrkH
MFLFSFNFGLYFLLLIRRWKTVVRNEELRVFLSIVASAVVILLILTRSDFASFGEALRAVVFQV